MNLFQLQSDITARASVLFVMHKAPTWEACRKMAAQMIAAERRAEAKRSKRALPPLSIPTSHADGLEGELATAKDRLFAKLADHFRRFDARRAAEKAAKRAARRQAKAAPTTTPAPASNVVRLHQPDVQPEPMSTHPCGGLVYAGNSTSAVRTATAGWRRSIEINEQRKREGIT